jgi:stage V sporulation protein AF
MASMNTPDMLSNSLSVVGGLILGDFAVGLGWLIPEVIILTAFVAIANFSQRSYELGYAFKFLRIMLLILSGLFGVWGFLIGIGLIIVLLATNKTVNGECKYLYPLIPFNFKALVTVLLRVRK